MEITSTTPLAPATRAAPAVSAASALGAAEFMQLLMAQLAHQDPLEPMNNAEMLTQFSQLNSLQELRDIRTALQEVSASSQTAYLASLLGKTVRFSRTNDQPGEGSVNGILPHSQPPQLLIGEETVNLSDVLFVEAEIS